MRILKYIVVFYLFAMAIGCSIYDKTVEPTHFDIRSMRCFYADSVGTYFNNANPYSGKYLTLDFTDSIYYFTPENAAIWNNNSGTLYANTIAKHIPSEEIEKILIISNRDIDSTFKAGDTINSITNINQILKEVNYQAQEKIYVKIQDPYKFDFGVKVQYFQTNGEYYECYK